MARKIILNKLSIYIPQTKQEEKLVERLIKLSDKKDRSVNYLAVEAVLEYLNRPYVFEANNGFLRGLKYFFFPCQLSFLIFHTEHRVIPHFRAMGPGADPPGNSTISCFCLVLSFPSRCFNLCSMLTLHPRF